MYDFMDFFFNEAWVVSRNKKHIPKTKTNRKKNTFLSRLKKSQNKHKNFDRFLTKKTAIEAHVQ